MSETLETLVPSQDQLNPLLMAWQTPFETPPFAEIRPDRAAARQPSHARPYARADPALGADLPALPPRRRRAPRSRQEPDGRDQRAAGASRHGVQPSSARR